jgi:hypothetical protein
MRQGKKIKPRPGKRTDINPETTFACKVVASKKRGVSIIKVTDHGCSRHDWRQILLRGSEGELLSDILANLPRYGDFHTFICEYGHTHHLSFLMQGDKILRH